VPRAPERACDGQIGAVVFNPSGATRILGTSIRIGMPLGSEVAAWHRPGAKAPDGSYALFRCGKNRVELVADAAASRTVWYVQTADSFIASTSQRAIVSLLGSFEANPNVIPWMLSSGTLGPDGGWDARVQQVLPGEHLTLDRARWRVSHDVAPVNFEPTDGISRRKLAGRFASVLDEVAAELKFDPAKWVLPLSGGVDSRGLLSMVSEHGDIRTITWGLNMAVRNATTDAVIAHRVAAQFGVENRYFSTNLSAESRERLIERFLVAGEGRIANIPPFLDGFAVWRELHGQGLDGIVRGDEAFGCGFVRNLKEVRHVTKLTTLSDHIDANTLASFELAPQSLPSRLMRRDNETLATWRDRLYQQHRLPKLLAGISDLQANYVEVVNPLLSRRILACVRELPDELRTGKSLWRQFVRARSGKIPFAQSAAVLPLAEFVNDTSMLEFMLSELAEEDIFSPMLRERICSSLRSALTVDAGRRRKVGARERLARFAPSGLRNAARRWMPATLELQPAVFAFRALIVARMNRLLKADAANLESDFRDVVSL
jgi:hypothetical protein